MFTRRSSLLLLLLPAIGYTFVMYTLIGRTCTDDVSAQSRDYTDFGGGGEPRRRRVLVKQHPPPSADKSGEIFVPLLSNKKPAGRVNNNKNNKDINPNKLSETSHRRKVVYPYNCTSISLMKLKKKIGHGVSKQTFLGEYEGQTVAVKMVTRHIHDVKTCLDNVRGRGAAGGGGGGGRGGGGRGGGGSDNAAAAAETEAARSKCYAYSTLKLMKEILLAQQLHHRNIAQLQGFCVRSEESDSTDVSEHGVVSVWELGSRFVLDGLQILPWPTRLRHALELADLLAYLHASPLGSLLIPDFKEGHFVLVDSSLKLIDLDDISSVEPACSATLSANVRRTHHRGGGRNDDGADNDNNDSGNNNGNYIINDNTNGNNGNSNGNSNDGISSNNYNNNYNNNNDINNKSNKNDGNDNNNNNNKDDDNNSNDNAHNNMNHNDNNNNNNDLNNDDGEEEEGEGRGAESECPYGVECQRALCAGFNAKENLKNTNRLLLKRLLFPLTFPEAVVRQVGQLNARLDLLALSAAQLKVELLDIQRKAHATSR